jgi:hypothetical protein
MENFLNSPEIKELENVAGQVANNPQVQGEARNIFNEITHNTPSTSTIPTTTTSSTSPLAASTSSIPSIVINDQESKKSTVPNLNLGSSLAPTRAMSSSMRKTSINTSNQLSFNINRAAKTERSARASDGGGQQGDVVVDISPMKRSVSRLAPSIQDNDLIDRLATVEKRYSPAEVWDIVSKANPTLHQFAVDHNLSLDDFLMFAQLKNQFDVSPQAVVDFVKTNKLPDDKKTADWNQPAKYEKIKNNDPQKYEEIVLEIFKAVLDEQDGQKTPSPLADTHINLLEDQVASDQDTKKKLWIAIGVKAVLLLVGVAGSIWGIYGQVHNPTAAPTNAPTYAPTFAPTFAPV